MITRDQLEKLADPWVTLSLVLVCLFGLVIAAFGPLWLKGVALAWLAFP